MRTSRFIAFVLCITLLHQISLETEAADLKLSKEHYDKSKLALEQSDLTVALESANKAIEANPRNASAYYLRASIFARKQDWEAAFKDSEKAVEINPDSSVFLTARGDLKFRRGIRREGLRTSLRPSPRTRRIIGRIKSAPTFGKRWARPRLPKPTWQEPSS